ncbi:MAG: 30S ribosomal protein S12 methylthiotransferase RimO [Anaerovoracaceae bacterium]|nr:30S ribosomal protein S12 methylthiotransferase RimO [Bacillota bacterium]MDY2670010.1 30S ribosomal protein S12 methylthiotransferase RimO [Anaerovoracaceae bacterium]
MRVYIETLGCPKNTVDSESMAAVLEKGGHSLAQDPYEADALVVNTCAFIKDAKEESIGAIFDMAGIKKDSGQLLLVTGCLPQRYAADLYKEMPEVDAFLGVNDYEHINEALEEAASGKRVSEVTRAPREYDELEVKVMDAGGASAYLRIAEGCDNVCSYCVIPAIRGPYRSRRMENIIKEAESLAAQGKKELILIAQDVSAYGKDIYGDLVLYKLLRELCKIDGIEWIRLLYCYEDSITDELIQTMKEEDKICNYIDIPLQHINDRILSDMNRHSTTASINDTISRLRAAIPDIHIRTTFITGFPGETEEEFEELQDFIEETKFDRLGVFSFSLEEDTPAAEMPDQVDDDVKDARRDALMELQREISLENNKKKIGSVLETIIDEKNDDGTYSGRTRYDAPEIDDGVILTSDTELQPGDIVYVKITDAFDYDLTGERIEK